MDYKEKYKHAKATIDKIKKAFEERGDPDDFCDTLNRILYSKKTK